MLLSKDSLFALLVFSSLSLSSIANATDAMELAKTTTNTDYNKDGRSDGNVDTFHKDARLQTRFNTHVASANLRGSLADAECIDAVEEACAPEPYFMGGNIDLNMSQLTENVGVLTTNSASAKFASTEAEFGKSGSIANICQEVPSTFGCLKGDANLLMSGKLAAENAISEGRHFLPEGKDAKEFLNKINDFVSLFNQALEQSGKSFSDLLSFDTVKDLQLADNGGSQGKTNAPVFNYSDYEGSNMLDTNKATKGISHWVGPKSLEDMSARIESFNGLLVADAISGQPLTLWQRATRRYQNFDLSRALTFAKNEKSRGKVRSPAAQNLARVLK